MYWYDYILSIACALYVLLLGPWRLSSSVVIVSAVGSAHLQCLQSVIAKPPAAALVSPDGWAGVGCARRHSAGLAAGLISASQRTACDSGTPLGAGSTSCSSAPASQLQAVLASRQAAAGPGALCKRGASGAAIMHVSTVKRQNHAMGADTITMEEDSLQGPRSSTYKGTSN